MRHMWNCVRSKQ